MNSNNNFHIDRVKLKVHLALGLLVLLFLTFGILQSLLTHYQFLSNNWDLGFHNQLIYKWAHFKIPSSTLWNPQYPLNHCFGDHVTLLMPINAQLYWIFGSYSLLIAQLIYMVIGFYGMYKWVAFATSNVWFGVGASTLFILHYSLWGALFFDVHDNVYGMMFLPWMFYFYSARNYKYFIICMLFFLMGRDDLSITGISLGIFLVLLDYKSKSLVRFGLSLFITSLIYYILVHYFVIPQLSTVPQGYAAWRFSHLGKTIPEVLVKISTDPGKLLSYFIDQPEKIQKLNYFLFTGGFLMFFNWRIAAAIIPTFLITCLSDTWALWGNSAHYNIVFAVTLPFLIAHFIYNRTAQRYHLCLFVISFIVYLSCLNNARFNDWQKFTRIFHKVHYFQRTNREEIINSLKLIPEDASVSAANYYTPHLAFREKAYFYPDLNAADFVMVNEQDTLFNTFPFKTKEEFKDDLLRLRQNPDYVLYHETKGVLIFKKKQVRSPIGFNGARK